jgi:hypothetical protein
MASVDEPKIKSAQRTIKAEEPIPPVPTQPQLDKFTFYRMVFQTNATSFSDPTMTVEDAAVAVSVICKQVLGC